MLCVGSSSAVLTQCVVGNMTMESLTTGTSDRSQVHGTFQGKGLISGTIQDDDFSYFKLVWAEMVESAVTCSADVSKQPCIEVYVE
jgi:hypothetical protein